MISTQTGSHKGECSSCHKLFKNISNGLCDNCKEKLETVQNERKKHVYSAKKARKGKTNQLFSQYENNWEYNIVKQFKLLFSLRVNNSDEMLVHKRKLVSFCKNVFRSECTIHVFIYFCIHGAATAQVLQVQLSMNYQSVYRVIKNLSNLGFIYPARKISKKSSAKGGPRSEVWALLSSEPSDVVECIKLHKRCSSPKYRMAEEILPTILDEFIRDRTEVTRTELIQYVKIAKLVKFNAHDIVELAIPLIQSKGIKVWR